MSPGTSPFPSLTTFLSEQAFCLTLVLMISKWLTHCQKAGIQSGKSEERPVLGDPRLSHNCRAVWGTDYREVAHCFLKQYQVLLSGRRRFQGLPHLTITFSSGKSYVHAYCSSLRGIRTVSQKINICLLYMSLSRPCFVYFRSILLCTEVMLRGRHVKNVWDN